MSSKRRDSKNRILEKGEFQREDGRYEFKYKDRLGKRRTVYSWKLVPTDRVPMGKKCDLSLREMEQKRQPLYRAFADITLENNGPIEETADKIIAALEELP